MRKGSATERPSMNNPKEANVGHGDSWKDSIFLPTHEMCGHECCDGMCDYCQQPILKMRKLIDLDEATFKTLSKLAIDNNTNLKSYIESVLVLHAGGGFKDKKPSTKRKLKH